MSSDSDSQMSRGVGPVFGGLRRALDGVSESVSARPFGVLVFLGSIALLVYLQTSSLSSFRADAVARAQVVDHPAQVSSFVTTVYVLPGDTIDVGAPLVELSSHFIDRELAQVDAEIEKLLHESRLAQARLLVEEQRWLSPSMRLSPDRPSLEATTVVMGLLIAIARFPDLNLLGLVLAASVILTLIWHLLKPPEGHPTQSWALTLGAALWLGWLISHFVQIRDLSPPFGLGLGHPHHFHGQDVKSLLLQSPNDRSCELSPDTIRLDDCKCPLHAG